MPEAKLLYALEKKGFSLIFPRYDTPEDLIINILREKNPRLDSALPLCLKSDFDYQEIKRKLSDSDLIRKLNKTILITKEICILEGLPHDHLDRIIQEEHIKDKIDKNTFNYFYDIFQESLRRQEKQDDQQLTKEMDLRNKLNTTKALATLFSPAKLRILEKISNHEALTMTELKYYYKSIKPINRAILHPTLQNYLRIIESAKKILLKKT